MSSALDGSQGRSFHPTVQVQGRNCWGCDHLLDSAIKEGHRSFVNDARRHDLDALRAAAMFLGLAYHASLSFAADFPWLVQDVSRTRAFYWFQAACHGFRMPLFFLLSGFFTAMLWRKRGLSALLRQRFLRVLLPCLLGLVTVAPLTLWLSVKAVQSGARSSFAAAATDSSPDLWTSIAFGDGPRVSRLLAEGADPNVPHPQLGVRPLTVAALYGHTRIAVQLLDHGADVNGRNADSGTPLHAAAFLGRFETAELLLARGADPLARNQGGQTPSDAARVDWPATQLLADLFRIPVVREQVEAGRSRLLERLGAGGSRGEPAFRRPDSGVGPAAPPSPWPRWMGGLMAIPLFAHLWFLWFLCWLVAGFAVFALGAERMGWRGVPSRLVLSPVGLAVPVAATLLPQWLMGASNAGFGPDTSIGLLPWPHVLFYYALFFGFGVVYHDSHDSDGRLGRSWRWMLPGTLLVVLPLGLEFGTGILGQRDAWLPRSFHRAAATFWQALYAWLMCYACMGMFRSLLTRESRTIRYLSDSAYWLYLAHLPLMIALQIAVRDWPLPAVVKCGLLTLGVTVVLLVFYDKAVRYTWLGTLLNGRRTKPASVRAGAAP